MKLGPLIRVLPAVVLAAAVVCALEALSDAAAGGDAGVGGEPATGPLAPAAPPDAAVAPGPVPDGGASRVDRHRARRFRRFGGFPGMVFDGGAPVDAARPGSLRDAGILQMAVPRPPPPPPVTPPPPAPPPPAPVPSGPSALPVTPDQPFNTCQKIPSGKRSVKANLKPDVELPELVAWISSVTCKAFVLPGHLSSGKKVTFVAQGMMTPQEAYAAFLSALDSNGLTVERGPGFYKIIETSKAKSSSLPVYDFDGRPTPAPGKSSRRPSN